MCSKIWSVELEKSKSSPCWLLITPPTPCTLWDPIALDLLEITTYRKVLDGNVANIRVKGGRGADDTVSDDTVSGAVCSKTRTARFKWQKQ
jgi:hypothetical protein